MRLLDETALLACAAYVDLNPIRAAMAQTLEMSDFTSVQRRIETLKDELVLSTDSEESLKPAEAVECVPRDACLARLSIDQRHDPTGPCCSLSLQRASDKGFLSMTTATYLELLDWTAREVRGDKRGATPQDA